MLHLRGKIVLETPNYGTRPRSIRPGTTAKDFIKTFGYREAETVAALIVHYCQISDLWVCFTSSDLKQLKSDSFFDEIDRGLGKLVREGWLVERDGVCSVTSAFIDRCYEKAPAD